MNDFVSPAGPWTLASSVHEKTYIEIADPARRGIFNRLDQRARQLRGVYAL